LDDTGEFGLQIASHQPKGDDLKATVKPDLKVHHFSAIKKQTPRRKSAPLLAQVS
jgi:hypothetical protein